ncbi:MAG: alpha-N-arabinofuranosidase [Chloroflexi bacterium]|nr:alpha-N-arabinofuranosidase [Chloroflexota bacterium]
MIESRLTVREDRPIGTISSRLYGHFAEHLGRCCYDGLWVGLGDVGIPTTGGFRNDVIAALKAMPVPLLRWPGGCYADHYHWRDGIGAPESRPRRLGMSCGLQVEDDNGLGTHEFIALCRLIGAEPYLAGNMGSGTPQELCDWLEYCNAAINTTLAAERRANGAAAPFGVKLWGVGNENWGCGGHFDAESYAVEYRRFATMLRHVDPTAELVICGHDDAWNETLIEASRRHMFLMDHFSIHRYWINGGKELDFDVDHYYGLLAEADATEDFVIRTAEKIRGTLAGSAHPTHRVGIALDEWGVWHPEARSWGPDGAELHRDPTTYEQAGTLRDALAAGAAFEGFHRQCNVLTLANLAQIVNVLHAPVMTEGPTMWVTPTYYAFQLHAPHMGAQALPVEVAYGASLPGSAFSSAVTGTASASDGGTAVTVMNRHIDQSATVTIDVAGTSRCVEARLLSGDSPRAVNSAQEPDRVGLSTLAVSADGAGRWRVELPPHSMATMRLA